MNKRVNLTLDEDLIAKVDKYADAHYLSRSGFFSFVADQFLLSQSLADSMYALAEVMQRIADTNTISDEDRKKLNELEILVSMMKNR